MSILDGYIFKTLVQDSGYTAERIPEKIRKGADYILVQKELGTVAESAAVDVGNGDNGIVTTVVDQLGSDGNLYTLAVEIAGSTGAALSASISGTDITVTLGTDTNGDPDPTKNTASLVATEIDALADVSASASGDGSTAIGANDVNVYGFRGGIDAVAETDITRDYQIIKTPNNDLYNHVGSRYHFVENNHVTDAGEKVDILAVDLNGRWFRNF